MPDLFGPIRFDAIVRVHDVLGFLLLGNSLLGLCYYLASGSIRQHLPERRGFLTAAVAQARYYLYGMFHGRPHPFRKTAERRLNPLQQATYLVTLNVLVPIQVITGMMIYGGAARWVDAESLFGGLATLGAIHAIVAYLLAAFLATHVYLITTGHTPLANLKAMIFGYEMLPAADRSVPDPPSAPDSEVSEP